MKSTVKERYDAFCKLIRSEEVRASARRKAIRQYKEEDVLSLSQLLTKNICEYLIHECGISPYNINQDDWMELLIQEYEIHLDELLHNAQHSFPIPHNN